MGRTASTASGSGAGIGSMSSAWPRRRPRCGGWSMRGSTPTICPVSGLPAHARAAAWAAGAAPGAGQWLHLDVDATITIDHSDNKQDAAATWKKTWGHHSLLVFLDRPEIAGGEALAELLSQDLSGLDLVALMIDGVHFAESCCVVALGIDIEGNKHPLALVEGSTENATLVCGLLVDLRERGLDVTRPMLVGVDGSKALRKAVLDVLDRPVIPTLSNSQGQKRERSPPTTTSQHCGTQDDRRLPRRISAGGRSSPARPGQRTRPYPPRRGGEPARGPRRDPHGAAPERSAHPRPHAALDDCIESMISVCREHAGNVKRWRDGQMALRWCAAGMVEAGKQFRRVNGHLHLPTLRAALERESAESVATMGHDDQVSAA